METLGHFSPRLTFTWKGNTRYVTTGTPPRTEIQAIHCARVEEVGGDGGWGRGLKWKGEEKENEGDMEVFRYRDGECEEASGGQIGNTVALGPVMA